MVDKVIVFLGPSLKRDKASSILEAEYRPPARKGDLYNIINSKGNGIVIGLIDGVFLQDYPPTPIEVYTALQRGIKVVGAASIGALRAVELERYGMIGIGKIFRLYKYRVLEDDDEVAVTFSEHDYTLHSEAMIDVRYTLYHACKESIISKESKKRLVRIAKSIYFPYRSYDNIIEKARGLVSDEELNALQNYVRVKRRSLKEEDSIRLLNYLKSL